MSKLQAIELISTIDMSREIWLQHRKKGIGGSDVSAIAGISKWKSPLAVYLDKIGDAPEQPSNEVMEWGNILEPVIATRFEEVTGLKVRRCNKILQHPEPQFHFALANVDRLVVGEPAGLEIKTANEYAKQDWADGRIPDDYMLQIQHYMFVTGLPKWYVAVLIGGNKFEWREVNRDDEIIAYLSIIEGDFWNMVETKTPPPVDGTQSSTEVLDLLYPASVPESIIELPPEAADYIAQFDRAKEEVDQANARLELAKNQLKALMGNYEKAAFDTRTIHWKTITSNRVDTKKLKGEHPDIYLKVVKESSSRRFEIK